MVYVEPFEIELWMDEHQPDAKYDLAETCCASLSLSDLTHLGVRGSLLYPTTKLTYGAIRGSDQLRKNVARLYDGRSGELDPENVLIAAGAIGANLNVLYSLIGPGDHVICMYPTYQQLYSVPKSLGADVSLWKLKPENSFKPDFDELKAMLRPSTRLVIINNPNNPTGIALINQDLTQLVEILQVRGITILSDEVYRPLWHSVPALTAPPRSILDFGYTKVIATGSMSKAFSLAGARVGWMVSRDRTIIELCANFRHYATISVAQMSDWVATYALETKAATAIIERNIALARTNVKILEDFITKYSTRCSWVKPVGGTTAFVKFEQDGKPVDDEKFCLKLLADTGVFISPGSRCFGGGKDFKGYVRIGYCCETSVLEAGLKGLVAFLDDN